jgi:hypothetical protein
MPIICKSVYLRVPLRIIYRALKDTRIEKLFPEFFIGTTRRIVITKENNEIGFDTRTDDGQIQIKESFVLKIAGENSTAVTYTTETNIENNPVVDSIIYTHIANIIYALLMLETGYVNGLLQDDRDLHTSNNKNGKR